MKIQIDRKADALYFRLREGTIIESEEVRPGFILDFDEKGDVIGIEVLDASKHMNADEISSVTVQNVNLA
ncbi:MAG: DUF2283 domain-containing protein [Candidatus Cloacimonetes bacterium]|nr:DUF2283 domain-containing protein [Candidatus Cloacimonadota bacterium]